MLVRMRSGLLVFATLLAGPIAACSSSSGSDCRCSGEEATEASTTNPSNTSDSGGEQGAGGSGAPATNGNVTNSAASGSDATSASGSTGGSSGGAGGPSEGPYANVVAVGASGDDGSYSFNVSVESADIDCSQFADWWEVVREDGTLLYRRILEHSHTDANGTSDADAPGNTFTRSGGPVNVLANEVVLVRAHMSNLDQYNGAVMRGSVADGFATASDLDPAFAADLESAAPQPEACLF